MYQNIFFDNETYRIHLWDSTLGYKSFQYKPYAYENNINGEYKTIFGNKVSKVYKYDRNNISELYEADVQPTIRTLVDIYYDAGDEDYPEHRIFTIDIEVEHENGFPDIINAENKITSIAIYYNITDEYIIFILDEDNKLKNNNIKFDKFGDNVSIKRFDDEKKLLDDFILYFEYIRPTILTGWNIDFFDVPYLIRRIRKILGNDEVNRLSPIGKIKYSDYRNKFFIAGVSVLDYLSLYKKFTFIKKPSYRLDSICKDEINEGKTEYSGSLQLLYETDIFKFIEYNLNDVYLVVKLDNKRKLIDLTIGISHKGKIPYEDIYFSSHYLEGALLCELKKKKLVAINKPVGAKYTEEDTFVGAFVKEPIKGKYEWVFDLDLTSLYPSIIMSLNISPETKAAKILDWNVDDFINKKNRTYNMYYFKNNTNKILTYDEFKEFLSISKCTISSNGILYVSKEKKIGILPEILNKWFNERVKYKELMKKYGHNKNVNIINAEKYEFYDKLQEIQKQLLNSLYGVLGLPIFRFYDLDNAEATTLTGQTVIKFTEKSGNEFYNDTLKTDKFVDFCIYIDTDSVFFSATPILNKFNLTSDVSNKVLLIADKTQKYINEKYNILSKEYFNIYDEHRFNVKQELICKSGIWIAKKRYALSVILREGIKDEKLIVKGLDTVRSSFPPAFKGFLIEILNSILNNENKDKIDSYILNFESNLNKIDLLDIARNTSINNLDKYYSDSNFNSNNNLNENNVIFSVIKKGTPIHVKAAIFFNDLIRYFSLENKVQKIQSGEKIKYVYLKNNSLGIQVLAFRGFDDPNEIIDFLNKNIDRYEIYNRELKTKIEGIYDSMKWSYPTHEAKLALKFFK